jgi:hypothetical protein
VKVRRNAHKVLLVNSEKRPLVRPRCRWKDNIKKVCKEIEFENMGWIQVAQNKIQ